MTCNPFSVQWEATLGCNSRFGTITFPIVDYISGSIITSTGATTETAALGGALNAYSVQIRFQATDLPGTTSQKSSSSLSAGTGTTAAADLTQSATTASATFTTTSPVTSTTSGSAATSGRTATTSTAASTGGGGLSTGAAAGIGVGSALGTLLLAGIALLFVKRRSARRKALDGDGRPAELGDSANLTGGHNAVPPHTAQSWELYGHPRFEEVDARGRGAGVGGGKVHEMPTAMEAVELPAYYHHREA